MHWKVKQCRDQTVHQSIQVIWELSFFNVILGEYLFSNLKKKIIEGQKYYCEMAVLLQALNNKRLYFEMCQVPLQGVLCASMCVCGLPRMISTDITTLTQVSAADSAPFRHFWNLQLTLQTADRKRMMN